MEFAKLVMWRDVNHVHLATLRCVKCVMIVQHRLSMAFVNVLLAISIILMDFVKFVTFLDVQYVHNQIFVINVLLDLFSLMILLVNVALLHNSSIITMFVRNV